MRRFLLCIAVLAGLSGLAQKPFQDLGFTNALVQAKSAGKLLFIQYEADNCAECNRVADKGFSNPALAARLEAAFVCIRVSPKHPDRARVTEKYGLTGQWGSLFIDATGRLVSSYFKTTTSAADFNKVIDIALFEAGEASQLSTYEKEYAAGNRSPGLLEAYILKKRDLGQSTTELLDEYAASLPPDSLKSDRVLQFIALQAPVLGSRADEAFRNDQLRFDHAWYVLPARQRVIINTAIISKSKKKAVQDKNEAYALQVSAFAQSTYVGDAAMGMRAFENTMMDFYRAIRDTSKYLPVAVSYYERYYMSLSLDSMRRAESVRVGQVLKGTPPSDTVITGNVAKITRRVAYSPATQNYTRQLTAAAQSFYELTPDPARLASATRWLARALELYQTPEALDTYARLLYVQGQKTTAIETEQKAIALRKTQGFTTADLEGVLQKMLKGRLTQDLQPTDN